MTTPAFNTCISQKDSYIFPSSTEAPITKLVLNTGIKELQIHFSSKDEVLKFCRANGFIADFCWLNFSTFEGDDLKRMKPLLDSFFVCEKAKGQFEALLNQMSMPLH